MSPGPKRAVIIGGGVIGAACAYYLSKSAWQVTIVERDRFGRGCSHANCGLVCPSHVLPLAEPGAVAGALRALFQKDRPFYIKPRWDPRLWSWLLHFALRSSTVKMLEAGQRIQALLKSSMALYRQLVSEEPLDCEWQARGLLYVFRTPAEFEHYAATDRLLAEHFNLPARRLPADELLAFEPALRPDLPGGYYYQGDAQLRPDRLLSSWRRILENRGVQVREQCEFLSFNRTAGRATAALTSQGEIAADAFVMAAGALTPRFARELGCRLPIQPGKGYSMTMPRPARCPQVPLILVEDKVAVTPMQSGYRLGSTMELAGYDATLNRQRLELLKTGAARYLKEPYCEPVQEEWFGWRPMTYDGLPIIGASPALPNVLVAAGHNMLGVSMSPATGRLVAELLDGQPGHIDPSPYSPARF